MNTDEKIKEHFERCAAFGALALFNHIAGTDFWNIKKRPAKSDIEYDFDVYDDASKIVGSMEVKRIVEPMLDRQSAAGQIIEEVVRSLSGRVPGQFQLSHIALSEVPTRRKQKATLVEDLGKRIMQDAPGMVTGQLKWVEEPISFILRKIAEKPLEIQPVFGFTGGSGPLNKQFYLELIQHGIKKANQQLSASSVELTMLVLDSRTLVTRIFGTDLLTEALRLMSKADYESIQKIVLVEWPSDAVNRVAGVFIQGFPM